MPQPWGNPTSGQTPPPNQNYQLPRNGLGYNSSQYQIVGVIDADALNSTEQNIRDTLRQSEEIDQLQNLFQSGENIVGTIDVDGVSSETAETLVNAYAREAFDLIRFRGLNPLRAEILGEVEFVPMGTGESSAAPNSNSISLNYGADNQSIQVNQVVRLIELHRVIRQTMQAFASQLIEQSTGVDSNTIDNILNNLPGFLALFFGEVFETAYPYGNITDSDPEVILNNLLNATTDIIRNDSNSNAGVTQYLYSFNGRNLQTAVQSTVNVNESFGKSLIRVSIVNYLIGEIIGFIASISEVQSEINRKLDLSNISKNTIVFDDERSKLIFRYVQPTVPSDTDFLKIATQLSDPHAGQTNTIKLINVLSNLYASALFFKNSSQAATLANETLANNSIFLRTDDINFKRLGNGISRLKSFYPTHSTVLRAKVGDYLNGLNYFRQDAYHKYEDDGLDSSLITGNVQSMLDAADPNDLDQAIANLVAAVCYDQVVGYNVNTRANASAFGHLPTQGFNSGTGVFPALEAMKKLVFNDVVSTQTNRGYVTFDEYKIIKEDTKDSNIAEALNSLTDFADTAVGLQQDPFNSANKIIPLEYSNALNSERSASPTSNIRLGSSAYFLGAVLEGDVNLNDFGNFIDEYEAQFKKVRDFVVDYYSLGFDADTGHHDTQYGSAGKISGNLNPASYFYYFMKILANDLDNVRNSTDKREAINLAFFAESGNSVGEMIKAFKSAYFGVLCSKSKYLTNDGFNSESLIDSDIIQNVYDHLCYHTDSAVIDLLGKISGLASVLRTDNRNFKFDSSKYTTLLSNNNTWLTDDNFDQITTSNVNFFYGTNGDLGSSGDSFMSMGDRSDAKDAIQSSVRVYDNTDRNNEIATNGAESRGIRPCYDSKYLHRLLSNSPLIDPKDLSDGTPILQSNTINSNVFTNYLFSVRQDDDDNFDEFVVDSGVFGGIFNTTSFQRALIFYMFAMRLVYNNTHVNIHIQGSSNHMKVKQHSPSLNGIVAALKLEPRPSGTNYDGQIKNAYNDTRSFINKVKNAIERKRAELLAPLHLIQCQIKELKDLRARAIQLLNSQVSLNSSPGRYVSSKLISGTGFLNNAFVSFNETTIGGIHKSLINHFSSPVNENLSSAISLKDSYSTTDIKIMYKTLTQSGYNFNSNERLGRKKIMHIGLPIGMLNALRQMSFDNSGDEKYLNSTNIAIQVVKTDDLHEEMPYYPRVFVFDMKKHVMPKTNFQISNHILNYSDNLDFNSILDSIETYVADAQAGLVSAGIGLSGYSNNPLSLSMLKNHVFDYYLKLYCRITSGLDFDEETFKINSNNIFTGQTDITMEPFLNDYVESLIQLYPSSNVNNLASASFYRALSISKNYINFSVFRRLESALSSNCFDRVFSIPISERDFLIPVEDYGVDYNQIFQPIPNAPPADPTRLTTNVKLSTDTINIAFGQTLFDTNRDSGLDEKLDEYLKSLNPDSTHISKYSIQVALLKE